MQFLYFSNITKIAEMKDKEYIGMCVHLVCHFAVTRSPEDHMPAHFSINLYVHVCARQVIVSNTIHETQHSPLKGKATKSNVLKAN